MSLLAEERKKTILLDLDRNGKVRVADLAEQFNVSTETIRRYLEELEDEKKLKKVYGGAVRIERGGEPTMFEREILRIDEKKKIAQSALQFIKDRDVIIIDEGSTPLQMVEGLCQKRQLTVITNSFSVTSMLISYTNKNLFDGEIIFIGGTVQPLHYRTGGSLSGKFASDFYANKAFISADGLDHRKGVTSYNLEKAQITKVFMNNATESYLMVDHSKLNAIAPYKIADFIQFDHIITTGDFPNEWDNEMIKERWVQC
ncbi:DeoR/GlpR transcriptional regulator [Bacillaceae bacterium SIJ1]|uniref:DeoR/GlpR family DNA-binding transcription regulator n=1 Tax=Litoribacterium kuwaitense TaxID=1398745 RepID=UPI0013EB7342|nr:DeoR/GlpR family DNA-binding transcription regulator [Litoribacterium kuwaitense]NGP44915.1 DeoR/GlpR transcriptional regulator [Litoribacterium kuwaitense]